jgi:hypothetical protein
MNTTQEMYFSDKSGPFQKNLTPYLNRISKRSNKKKFILPTIKSNRRSSPQYPMVNRCRMNLGFSNSSIRATA